MYARKHDLERKKRAYVFRNCALRGSQQPNEGEDDDEEEEDPLVVQEVREEVEADARTTYRLYDEEDEEEG